VRRKVCELLANGLHLLAIRFVGRHALHLVANQAALLW
jgi:hypothetical protein